MCCPKKTSRKSKSVHPWMHLFANSTRIWFRSHLLEKTKDAFRQFSPINGSPNEDWAKLIGLPPAKSILYGYLYTRELNTCHVALISRWSCAADGRFLKYYNSKTPYYYLRRLFLYMSERLLLWGVQALLAFLDWYIHARLQVGETVAAVLIPGPSWRAETPTLTIWSQQSGSG